MDKMTREDVIKYIRKLKNYQEGNERKKKTRRINDSLFIVEPKFFEMLFNEMKPTKILELERVSNSCSQICSKMDISYKGLHHNDNIASWDGDIISGFGDIKNAESIIKKGLSLLQEGRFFAICQKLTYVYSTTRYYHIFKDTPFDRMYCSEIRPYVSKTGDFSDGNAVGYYEELVWYVWLKGNEQEHPTIHWLEDILEYYLLDDMGFRVKNKLEGSEKYQYQYKKPIKVRVDKYAKY